MRRARKHLSAVPDTALRPFGPRDAGFQVEFSPIAGRARRVGRINPQISEGLVALREDPLSHDRFLDHALGLDILAVEEHVTDLREMAERSRDIAFLRRARPEGVFVELNALVPCDAEHHAPEPSVADRKSLNPLCGRAGIPQQRLGRKWEHNEECESQQSHKRLGEYQA